MKAIAIIVRITRLLLKTMFHKLSIDLCAMVSGDFLDGLCPWRNEKLD